MKVIIRSEVEFKTLHLSPQIVIRRATIREDGISQYAIYLYDVDASVVAFCRSKMASKRLEAKIRLGKVPDLRAESACLGLAGPVHPPGWPDPRTPETHFDRADEQVVRAAGVHVPLKAVDVFPAIRGGAFCIVPTLPDGPYKFIRYNDVNEVWMKNERVGLQFERHNMEGGLCRLNVVMTSKKAACDLATSIRKQHFRALRVNRTVRAIFQEIQPAPHEHRLVVDGLDNLWPRQQRILSAIGLTLMPNRCYLSSILRWEHARQLAAQRLF